MRRPGEEEEEEEEEEDDHLDGLADVLTCGDCLQTSQRDCCPPCWETSALWGRAIRLMAFLVRACQLGAGRTSHETRREKPVL